MRVSNRVCALVASGVALAAFGVACAQDAAAPANAAAGYISGVTGHAQPDQAALEQARAAGYAAVIDLRTPAEDRGLPDERAAVESLGMSYITLPIAGAGDISFDNASELDRLLAQFDKPVYVHCASGNRAGALLALRAKLNGADDETAIEAGRETGLKGLEDVVRQRLQEH